MAIKAEWKNVNNSFELKFDLPKKKGDVIVVIPSGKRYTFDSRKIEPLRIERNEAIFELPAGSHTVVSEINTKQ